MYDVVVLGGGPGGYEAAIRSAQYGLKTALIESDALGGTCLNKGCIPTKALLHSAELYHDALNAKEAGVICEKVEFDYERMASNKDSIVFRLSRGIASLERAYGVDVIQGFGVLKDAHTIVVNQDEVSTKNIILATGSTPACPPIPGIEGNNVLDSDGVLSLTECPESLVIIGGGVIGIEFATLFALLGRPVTVIEMLPSILPGVCADITSTMVQILEEKNVKVVTGARVTAINSDDEVTVAYELEGESKQASASHCIVCVGRKPRTSAIGLEEAGVILDRGFVQVDETMRTSLPNIFAIGDITGKIQLAHVATAQGMVAAANCAGKSERMDYSIVPACVYTSPEIAYVGITEDEAESPVNIGTFNLAGNGKAMVMGEKNGFVKVVSDASTGEILGAQLLAPRATDLIAEVAAVMKSEGTIEELAETIHPHPTISESLMEAAHDAMGLCCNAAPKTRGKD